MSSQEKKQPQVEKKWRLDKGEMLFTLSMIGPLISFLGNNLWRNKVSVQPALFASFYPEVLKKLQFQFTGTLVGFFVNVLVSLAFYQVVGRLLKEPKNLYILAIYGVYCYLEGMWKIHVIYSMFWNVSWIYGGIGYLGLVISLTTSIKKPGWQDNRM